MRTFFTAIALSTLALAEPMFDHHPSELELKDAAHGLLEQIPDDIEARAMEMTGLNHMELETMSLDILEEIMSELTVDQYKSLIQKTLTTRIFEDARWSNDELMSEEDKSDLVAKRLLEKQILSDVESIHEGIEGNRRRIPGLILVIFSTLPWLG